LTSAYIRARGRYFKPSTTESALRKLGIYPFNPEIILSTLDPPSIGIPLEEDESSLLEEVPRILRERSRDKTPPIIPFEDLVEEVISRGVLSPRTPYLRGREEYRSDATTERATQEGRITQRA
jgi:hypothetical protein